MNQRICRMLALAALILGAAGVLIPASASGAAPVAVLESPSYDFGSVYEGIDVVHDFIVKNTGDADLEIKSVKAG